MIEPVVQLIVSLVWGGIILFGFISNSNLFPEILSADEEKELLQKFSEGDMQARNRLIEKNLRLVAHIAKRFASNNVEQEDLISIGTFGLIKAINTYKTDKNIRLATYASRCIENEILMYFRANKKTNQDVYLQEIVTSDKDGNDMSLIDIVSDDKISVEDEIVLKMQCEEVKAAIEKVLTKVEQKILNSRYGLKDGKEYTQLEIAKSMGISRSYVSRLESRAIEKLKKELVE